MLLVPGSRSFGRIEDVVDVLRILVDRVLDLRDDHLARSSRILALRIHLDIVSRGVQDQLGPKVTVSLEMAELSYHVDL